MIQAAGGIKKCMKGLRLTAIRRGFELYECLLIIISITMEKVSV